MKVGYITNADAKYGVGVRSTALKNYWPTESRYKLNEIYFDGNEGELVIEGKVMTSLSEWPGVFGSKSINWIRLGRWFKREIKIVEDMEFWHLTNQSLSFLANKLRPCVITVHDVIEVRSPQDWRAELVNKYLYGGITKADQIICVSEFTAAQVRDLYGIDSKKMTVSYNGVKPVFRLIGGFGSTMAALTLRHRWRIPTGAIIILYVGSEHPRKNVSSVLRVVAGVKKAGFETVLLKVGRAGLAQGRQMTLEVADKLRLREEMRLIENVSEEELNDIYNLADVLVYPSFYEGFGLPSLEAMAAGTPVICSNSTSLPEVVGDDDKHGSCAAMVYDPEDTVGMTQGVVKIFQDNNFRDDLIEKGIQRAAMFNWSKTASQVENVYDKISSNG